jgi:hypothetical protein
MARARVALWFDHPDQELHRLAVRCLNYSVTPQNFLTLMRRKSRCKLSTLCGSFHAPQLLAGTSRKVLHMAGVLGQAGRLGSVEFFSILQTMVFAAMPFVYPEGQGPRRLNPWLPVFKLCARTRLHA